ncbi:MAG: orotidine-5'-phosphate decarboxylase [Planctomycetota bacterium]
MYAQRLEEAVKRTGSIACLGLDPFIELMPPDWKAGILKGRIEREGAKDLVRAYLEEALEAARGLCPAVKPQSAFFEALGQGGTSLMRNLIATAKAMGFLVIADVKRGDIGTTAAAYAKAFLPLADAVTVNPYMGIDSVEPFIEEARRNGGGVYVLVRTSNPSAADFQDLDCSGSPLYMHVAHKVRSWGERLKEGSLSSMGAVVGATWPEQGKKLREVMPDSPFLIPGYGAQGGSRAGVEACRRATGGGLLVNASRSLLYAWKERQMPDWREALQQALKEMNADLHGLA